MNLFDWVLAITLVLLAWRSLTVPDLFRGIVLFIMFGLLLALCWVRLDAPDLALAEAAIGAGLLGVLLLGTWRVLGSPRTPGGPEAPAGPWLRWGSGVGSTVLAVTLSVALHQLPEVPESAGTEALERLNEAGTTQPVTAVLLNFRGYDTLLEIAVLLVALLGALQARAPLIAPVRQGDATDGTPLMPAILRLFTPVLLLVGAYLVWAGTHGSGGAFQGGAVLAGCGVLLALGNRLHGADEAGPMLRGLLGMGLIVFILIGIMVMIKQGAFLAYPPGLTYPLMLAIEYSMAVSIALSLLLLFTATPGLRRSANSGGVTGA